MEQCGLSKLFIFKSHSFPLFNLGRDLLQLLDQDLDNNIKSATLKSTQADYTTPPESPVMPHPLFKTVGESTEKPPVPPPRQKRHQKSSSSASQNKSEDSTAVLEEVAKDLIRMSSEIDQRLSSNDPKVETKLITKDEDLLKGKNFRCCTVFENCLKSLIFIGSEASYVSY